MTTERDSRSRIVLSWLREDAHENPELVLLRALDEIDTTPQRRPWWPGGRPYIMSTYAKMAAAAAVVLVVAVVGYQFLTGRAGPGTPTSAPSPSPSALAQGTFVSHGVSIELDAVGDGANVTGTLEARDEGGGTWSVDLQCTATNDLGLVLIGGEVTASTQLQEFPVGSDTAMIFERGSPVKAIIFVPMSDPPAADCMTFLASLPTEDTSPGAAALEPVDGTLVLRP